MKIIHTNRWRQTKIRPDLEAEIKEAFSFTEIWCLSLNSTSVFRAVVSIRSPAQWWTTGHSSAMRSCSLVMVIWPTNRHPQPAAIIWRRLDQQPPFGRQEFPENRLPNTRWIRCSRIRFVSNDCSKTDGQTDEQTDRQTDTHTHTVRHNMRIQSFGSYVSSGSCENAKSILDWHPLIH